MEPQQPWQPELFWDQEVEVVEAASAVVSGAVQPVEVEPPEDGEIFLSLNLEFW